MIWALGYDHAGFPLAEHLAQHLTNLGDRCIHYGPAAPMPAVDYAPFCIAAALEVVNGEADYGIVIGASAQGEQIAANKVKGVRAALVTDVHFAKLARRDNDANIIALPGRIIAKEYAVEILSVWIQTQFEGGRHARRLNDIKLFEEGLLDLKATKPRSGDREQ